MRTYDVTITGKTPLLMHYDNIEWADAMEKWKLDPKNKKHSKAGDDRTPAFRWIGSLYHDGKVVAIPQDNIMRALMEGGAMVPVPGGKSGKTFKSQTQSGMVVAEPFLPLSVAGAVIPVAPIMALKDELSYEVHQKTVQAMGFELFPKRAKIGQNKHIRIRPMFAEGWTLNGQISVWDDQITADVLLDILTYAGNYKGLCDWRPGGKTPGPYGRFTATIN